MCYYLNVQFQGQKVKLLTYGYEPPVTDANIPNKHITPKMFGYTDKSEINALSILNISVGVKYFMTPL